MINSIPQPMATVPRFILWKLEEREGKPTKIPYSPKTGYECDATRVKSADYVSLAEAISVAGNGSYSGIGFCLAESLQIVCLDLDHCLDEDELATWAIPIVEMFPGTYMEVSQSGTGLHIFFLGKIPGPRRKGTLPGGGTIELYADKRYIAVTGNVFRNAPAELADCQNALDDLYQQVFRQEQSEGTATPIINTSVHGLDDRELLDRMFNAKNGAAIRRLWDGDTGAHGGDDSSADLALMNHLAFWTGKDATRMEALFSQSALAQRKKWQRSDYRGRTIQQAIRMTSEVFEIKQQKHQNHNVLELAQPHKDGWPEPLALPDSLPPVEKFEPSLLPDAFRPWLEDVSERIQCPPDFTAIGAMVALAALVGRQVGIRPKAADDWICVPNLWGAIIGRPGLMKSPALKEPMKPLSRMEQAAAKEYEAVLKQWEVDEMVSKEEKAIVKQDIKNAIKSKKDPKIVAMAALADSEKPEPIRKRYKVNDTTVEKLGEILAGNPNGILIYRDELTGFLRGLEKQGQESARAFYLEAWNGDDGFSYDRIGRGTLDIPAATVSILGGIQPGPLQAYLQDTFKNGAGDDGLLQRFQLVVWPDAPKLWQNIDREPDKVARDMAYAVFDRLAHINPVHIGAETTGPDEIPFLRFTPEAQEAFTEWRTVLEIRLRSNDECPAFEAHLSKYRSLIPSLALLIHLADEGHGPVGIEALTKACAWGEYLESHAQRLYSVWTHSGHISARTLLKHIQTGKLGNPFTLREIYRHDWSGLSEPAEAKKAVEILEAHHIVRAVEEQTGGRPKEEFYINPKIMEVNYG